MFPWQVKLRLLPFLCAAALSAQQAPVFRADVDLVRAGDRVSDPGHHRERHWLIAFIVQAEHRPALGLVADGAFECDHRAFRAGQQTRHDGARIDRVASQREIVAVFGNLERVRQAVRATTAHGRQESHLIAILDFRGEVRKLPVASQHNAARHFLQGRTARGHSVEDRPQIGPGGKVGLLRGPSHQILQYPKEQDSHAHTRLYQGSV